VADLLLMTGAPEPHERLKEQGVLSDVGLFWGGRSQQVSTDGDDINKYWDLLVNFAMC
jgi:hypothetical protein